MIVVIATALFLEHFLTPLVPLTSLRTILIMILSLALQFFLSTSLLEHYKTQEENLKNLVDETLHELNTPIATIEANLKMLEKSHNDEKTQKRLSRIKQASKNLSTLYESIEHSIKSEIALVEKSTFDLHTLIEKSIHKVSDIHGDVTIENNTPPLMLKSEQNGFERAIDNLLSNAIKYNRADGKVTFSLKGTQLFIQDTGRGIDSKNLFIIFDKTYQENPSTQGFGLGLSIVKSFCDKEDIMIKIETKKDKGTTIMMELKNLTII